MESEPLGLTHQHLLEERFKKMAAEISEYTFANLYLFRAVHHHEVIHARDIYIKGKSRDGLTYLMPTVPFEDLDKEDFIESAKGCDCLFPIPLEWERHFNSSQYRIHFLEQDSDYLYQVDKMKDFPGRKLSGRRNLLKQFYELFPAHRTAELTSQNAKDALNVLEGWIQEGHDKSDASECQEALDRIEQLKLSGQITYIDDKPAAFVIGEPLNSKIHVLHFSKASARFKGIYQYMYHALALALPKNIEMLNFEQDLGVDSLRHAKRAYFPDRLVHKLRIYCLHPNS